MITEFVNCAYAKPNKQDFVVTDLAMRRLELIELLNSLEGDWVNWQVLKTKKDANKFYIQSVVRDKPVEVKAVEHMPDRVEDDMPF